MRNEKTGEKTSIKKMAAALAYDHIGVPKVVAKGDGLIAQKIIEFAKQNGIPVQNNETLVKALMQIELSKEIPPELYQVVAEVLAFIYKLDKTKAKGNNLK
jgi:flagellar biosynthesis protein